MARKNENPPPPPERSRVRLVILEVDGTSDDIRTLAQTFAQAARAPQAPGLHPRQPAPIPLTGTTVETPAAAAPAAAKTPSLFDDSELEEVGTAPEAAPPAPAPSSTEASKTTNGAKKKYKALSVIPGLDLTSGPKPFQEYMDEQAPDEHSKRYLVIAQWLKEYRGIAEVGADHVYTCYRFLSMAVPEDVLLVFRALKSQGWVDKGSKRGLFKINHIGENKLIKTKGKE